MRTIDETHGAAACSGLPRRAARQAFDGSWLAGDPVGVAGRAAFAVGLAGFGVLCLYYADTVHQLQPLIMFVPASTPGYGVVGILTGVFLLAASGAVITGVRTRMLMLSLAAFFGVWIVALHVPSAFVEPRLLRSPWWIRTFETLALTGGAVVLAGLTARPARDEWIRLGGVLYGVSLPVFGVLHLVYADNVASLVPAFYPWPLFWAYLTAAGNIFGGAAITLGTLSRLAAILAGFMYGTYALTLHIPLAVTTYVPQLASGDTAALQAARAGLTSLFVAIGMWGSAWIVAGSLAGPRSVRGRRRDA
jgi:uncharacterized membrane protein YphA (DoxX/SURF4 family)